MNNLSPEKARRESSRQNLQKPSTNRPPGHVDIDDVKQRVDLCDVLERDTHGRRTGTGGMYACPFPDHDDSTPSLSVSEVNGAQLWRCHGCDRGGDVITYMAEMHGLNKHEAILRAAELAGVRPTQEWATLPPAKAKKPAPKPKPVPLEIDGDRIDRPDLLEKYRLHRGWKPETIDALDIHTVTRNGRAWIRHPYTYKGDVYGAEDRRVGKGNGPKWLAAKGAAKIPYNVDALDLPCITETGNYPHLFSREITITEGPADCITLLDTFGLNFPAIGIAGATNWKTNYTAALEMLARKKVPSTGEHAGITIVVAADNDEAGDKFRQIITEETSAFAHIAHMRIPDAFSDVSEWATTVGSSFADQWHTGYDSALRESLLPWLDDITGALERIGVAA